MNIEWKVEDGYVGNGTRDFDIDEEELKDCGSVEQALKMIEEYAQQEFNNHVSWCFNNYDDFKAELEKLFAEKAEIETTE